MRWLHVLRGGPRRTQRWEQSGPRLQALLRVAVAMLPTETARAQEGGAGGRPLMALIRLLLGMQLRQQLLSGTH